MSSQLAQIIKDAGFDLVRQKRHLVYQNHETGQILVTSATPSTKRFEQEVIAQLCRLRGVKKHDLLGQCTKRHRIRTPKPTPTYITSPTPVTPTPTAPATLPQLTCSERKFLRRIAKHEKEKQEKQRRQREWLTSMVDEMHQCFFEENAEEPGSLTSGQATGIFYQFLQGEGFHNTEVWMGDIWIDGQKQEHPHPFIHIGLWFLDFIANIVSDAPTWTIEDEAGVARIECYGALELVTRADGA